MEIATAALHMVLAGSCRLLAVRRDDWIARILR